VGYACEGLDVANRATLYISTPSYRVIKMYNIVYASASVLSR
jgi:hypothetical protein